MTTLQLICDYLNGLDSDYAFKVKIGEYNYIAADFRDNRFYRSIGRIYLESDLNKWFGSNDYRFSANRVRLADPNYSNSIFDILKNFQIEAIIYIIDC